MAVCVKWLAVVLPWAVERLVDPLCGQWTGCSGQSAGGGASTGAAGGGAWWHCRNNKQVKFICIDLHTIHRTTKQLYRKLCCYVCNALVLNSLILKKYLWKYNWILQVKSLKKRCLQIFIEAPAQYLPPPVASGLNEREVEGWNRKWTKLVGNRMENVFKETKHCFKAFQNKLTLEWLVVLYTC